MIFVRLGRRWLPAFITITPVKQKEAERRKTLSTNLRNLRCGVREASRARLPAFHHGSRQRDSRNPRLCREQGDRRTRSTKVLKSEQIAKYKTPVAEHRSSQTTSHFAWINKDGHPQRETSVPRDRPRKPQVSASSRIESRPCETAARLLFDGATKVSARAKNLALELAKRSKFLRDYLGEELVTTGTRRTREGQTLRACSRSFGIRCSTS